MMITIYKKFNGEITKICTCIESDISFQYDSTIEEYINGSYEYNSYYIKNGQPITIPDAPNQYCVFNYETKQWVDLRTDATQWEIIKAKRNQFLAISDWTQLVDVMLSNKDQWITYRQELRDITTQLDPFNIIWPTPPQG